MERERRAIGGPLPARRGIRHRRERRVVARERDEQREALNLARQRMDRDERIPRLEIGARRVDDDVGRSRRRARRATTAIAAERVLTHDAARCSFNACILPPCCADSPARFCCSGWCSRSRSRSSASLRVMPRPSWFHRRPRPPTPRGSAPTSASTARSPFNMHAGRVRCCAAISARASRCTSRSRAALAQALPGLARPRRGVARC